MVRINVATRLDLYWREGSPSAGEWYAIINKFTQQWLSAWCLACFSHFTCVPKSSIELKIHEGINILINEYVLWSWFLEYQHTFMKNSRQDEPGIIQNVSKGKKVPPLAQVPAPVFNLTRTKVPSYIPLTYLCLLARIFSLMKRGESGGTFVFHYSFLWYTRAASNNRCHPWTGRSPSFSTIWYIKFSEISFDFGPPMNRVSFHNCGAS